MRTVLQQKVMNAWNAGLTKDEMVSKVGSEAAALYDELEQKYGCACIPIHILHDFTPTPDTDPDLLAWRGITGPGKLLRDLIKDLNTNNNKETKT